MVYDCNCKCINVTWEEITEAKNLTWTLHAGASSGTVVVVTYPWLELTSVLLIADPISFCEILIKCNAMKCNDEEMVHTEEMEKKE